MNRKTILIFSLTLVVSVVLSALASSTVFATVGGTLSDYAKKFDVNGDGVVNISDVTKLLDYLSNPVEPGEDEPVYTEPTIVVGKMTAAAGEKGVQIPVMLVNNPGVASIALDVTYEDGLTLTSVVFNSAQLGGSTITSQFLSSPAFINWVNGTEEKTGDLLFATLYFDVSPDVSGSLSISVSYDEDNVYDLNEDNVYFATASGAVIIK